MTRERDVRRRDDARLARPAPAPPSHFVLGLQRSVGNAALSALLARAPVAHAHVDPAKGDLFDWEVTEELERVRGYRLDAASIQAIQAALKTTATGAFAAEDVRALAHLRKAHGLSRDATVDPRVIDLVVRYAAHHHMQDDAIHLVIDYFGLDARSDTLSVRFNPGLMIPMTTTFEATNLRRIVLGPGALTSANAVRRAIADGLAEPPSTTLPPGTAAGPPPVPLLGDAAVRGAVDFDAAALTDPRTVRAIQRTLGVAQSGWFDEDTVQAIAGLQNASALAVSGRVDEATFHKLIQWLASDSAEDSIIRLVVDYKRIPDAGVVAAEIDFALPAGREYVVGGAASRTRELIRFDPRLFHFFDPPHIALTVAKAFEEVRLAGTALDPAEQDFQLARFAVLAPVEDDFHLFMVEVAQVVRIWPTLPAERRAALAGDLAAIQTRVRERWASAPPAEQPTWQSTHDDALALAPH